MSDLIRTPHGWGYPPIPPRPCGSTSFMVGWLFCRCVSAAGGGHLTYRCKACNAVMVRECVGAVPLPGPMESYGCR